MVYLLFLQYVSATSFSPVQSDMFPFVLAFELSLLVGSNGYHIVNVKQKLQFFKCHRIFSSKTDQCNWNPIPYERFTVGVPRETFPGENRVGLTPDSAALLIKEGLQVAVESGCGQQSDFSDSSYELVGMTFNAITI